MTLTVFVFALVAALLIGVLGALLFTAFCVGVALLVLLPTLFITTFGATFIWLWGLGAYYLVKWFNQKEIPGIHTGFVDGVKDKLYAPSSENSSASQDGEHKEEPHKPKKLENGSAHKGEKKSGGGAPKLDKVGDVGGATGKVGDVTDKLGDVTDKADVGDLKKKADVGDLSKKADVGNVTKSVPGLS